jgi:hypothetical protein
MINRRTTKTKRVKRATKPAGKRVRVKRPTRLANKQLKAKKSTGLRSLKARKSKSGPPDTSYLSWIEMTDSPEWAIAS